MAADRDEVGHPQLDAAGSNEEMGRALSALYASGAVLAVVSLLIPGWPGRDEVGIVVPAAIAFAVATTVWLMRRWLQERACHALVAVGSVLIALVSHAAGPAAPSFALFFVWVSLYSFYFFSTPAAVVQWAWSVVALSVVMADDRPASLGLARWIVTAGTSLAAGFVVGRLVRQVRQMALRDWLTGALTRRAWDSSLEAALTRSARSATPVCVALVDLDELKALNDASGHAAGDAALRDVAASWRNGLRGGDVLARLGGDEFGVILEGCSLTEAADVVEQFRTARPPSGLTSSVGLACWDGRESPTALLARADAALYEAKAGGRDRMVAAGHHG